MTDIAPAAAQRAEVPELKSAYRSAQTTIGTFTLPRRHPCSNWGPQVTKGNHMRQFYAQLIDEEQCRSSVILQQAITITGLSADRRLRAFTGVVRSLTVGQSACANYPLHVTMAVSKAL